MGKRLLSQPIQVLVDPGFKSLKPGLGSTGPGAEATFLDLRSRREVFSTLSQNLLTRDSDLSRFQVLNEVIIKLVTNTISNIC